MSINGRVLLLLVVTALFIRVWTTNERHRTRPVSPPVSAAIPSYTSDADLRYAARDGFVAVDAFQPSRAPGESEEWTLARCPIVVPAGITAGVYRVVSDAGRVARLTVTGTEAAPSSANDAAAEFYVTQIRSQRWYFIRLNEQPATRPFHAAPASASLMTMPDVPDIAPDTQFPRVNRKYDFTGFVPAERPGAPVIEQTLRPHPPELPSPL